MLICNCVYPFVTKMLGGDKKCHSYVNSLWTFTVVKISDFVCMHVKILYSDSYLRKLQQFPTPIAHELIEGLSWLPCVTESPWLDSLWFSYEIISN